MKVILQREVESLGSPGDLVEVKAGYARNYLIPKGLAAVASKGAARHAERARAAADARARRERQEAEALAARLSKMPVRVVSQAGEDGRLFGSVTSQHIAEALSRTLGQEVDRRRIQLPEPIRSAGTHEVQVHLHPEVNASLTVDVVGE